MNNDSLWKAGCSAVSQLHSDIREAAPEQQLRFIYLYYAGSLT